VSFLAKIQSGKQALVPRIMIHGSPGVGKSTFASGAPDVLFLDIEGRTGHLDVNRLPVKNWADVKAALIEVGKAAKGGKPPCKWIVIDTVDHLDMWINDATCAEQGWANIEEPGYGKGYAVAFEHWKEFFVLLEGLRSLGVGVLLLAHSTVKAFQNPSGADYQTWGLMLGKLANKFITKQMDIIGFASFQDDVKAKFDRKGEQITKGKASTTGERVLYFGHNPAYETKQGINVPDEIDLTWAALEGALNPQETK
jgi:hypothetical protein